MTPFVCRLLSALCLACVVARPLVAQTATIRSLSLDQAVDRAIDAGDEVAIARAGIARAEGNQQIAASGFLPQINASLSYNRTLISQFSSVTGGDDAPEGDTSGGEMPSGLSSVLENLPFGQANQWTLGVTLSQTVFAGGRLIAMRSAADARRRSAEIELTSAQAQLVLNVAQSYFDALLADQMVSIVDSAYAQSDLVLRHTELAFKLGQKSEFEMLRARVARDNQAPQQIQRRVERDAAYDRIRLLLNIPLQDSLVLTSNVDEPLARFLSASDTSADVRAPVRQAGENVEASRAQLEIAESERWPFVSIVSRLSPVAYPKTILPAPDDFRTDWTVGFNVSIPLFTGWRIGGNEQVARAGIDEAEARLRQAREAASLEARGAQRDLSQSQAMLDATSGTVEQARRAYQIATIRFREGIATQVDLSDARLLLEQALANRARAQRNVHVARVRLALLRDLPLSTGGGAAAAAAAAAMQQGAGAAGTSGATTGGAQQSPSGMGGGAGTFQGTTGP
jgi:outer membrane protein TolC